MVKEQGAHPVDVTVGARVKAARVLRGMSQAVLAEGVGLTFQQIQKYERGTNRISASKLVQIARRLDIDPSDFLADLGGKAPGAEDFSIFSIPGGMELLVIYEKLRPREQRILLRLAEELAGDD